MYLYYTQVKLLAKIMFGNIPFSRFVHLIGNSGSKMWSKRTAVSAIQWKANMPCPMAGNHILGCDCPIKAWTNKKMFVAHWLIYHIDQHICNKAVRQGKDDGIACDGCDMWYHLRCIGLNENDFQQTVCSDSEWYCYICTLPYGDSSDEEVPSLYEDDDNEDISMHDDHNRLTIYHFLICHNY